MTSRQPTLQKFGYIGESTTAITEGEPINDADISLDSTAFGHTHGKRVRTTQGTRGSSLPTEDILSGQEGPTPLSILESQIADLTLGLADIRTKQTKDSLLLNDRLTLLQQENEKLQSTIKQLQQKSKQKDELIAHLEGRIQVLTFEQRQGEAVPTMQLHSTPHPVVLPAPIAAPTGGHTQEHDDTEGWMTVASKHSYADALRRNAGPPSALSRATRFLRARPQQVSDSLPATNLYTKFYISKKDRVEPVTFIRRSLCELGIQTGVLQISLIGWSVQHLVCRSDKVAEISALLESIAALEKNFDPCGPPPHMVDPTRTPATETVRRSRLINRVAHLMRRTAKYPNTQLSILNSVPTDLHSSIQERLQTFTLNDQDSRSRKVQHDHWVRQGMQLEEDGRLRIHEEPSTSFRPVILGEYLQSISKGPSLTQYLQVPLSIREQIEQRTRLPRTFGSMPTAAMHRLNPNQLAAVLHSRGPQFVEETEQTLTLFAEYLQRKKNTSLASMDQQDDLMDSNE